MLVNAPHTDANIIVRSAIPIDLLFFIFFPHVQKVNATVFLLMVYETRIGTEKYSKSELLK